MKIQTIKDELTYVLGDTLTEFLGKPINECSDEFLQKKFNEFCKTRSEKIKIKDLIDNYQETAFTINTPDGFQDITDFYIKSKY